MARRKALKVIPSGKSFQRAGPLMYSDYGITNGAAIGTGVCWRFGTPSSAERAVSGWPLAAGALRLAIGAGRSCAAFNYRVSFGELMKINEHDCVVLTADLPGESLETGDVGTVVHIHKGGAAYEVEFTTLDGCTLTVATVESKNLRPVSGRDVAHVRELQPV
jgi:hypothetical protein